MISEKADADLERDLRLSERKGEEKMQQISESELVLMKIIWRNGGAALYSFIMEELEKEQNEWKKNLIVPETLY